MKILRRALLGGAAVVAMVAGAQAGELDALKAQLEALQNRVQTLEARGAALPEGVSLLTVERGNSGLNNPLFANSMLDQTPASRGVTIAVTPTADLPAPVTSIELGGHIRAVALWQSVNLAGPGGKDTRFDLYTRGQVDMSMSTDTAIGRVTGGIQVRGTWQGLAGDANARMRTAWATWQMTDALSLTFGRTNQIATLDNVTSFGRVGLPVGPDNTRRTQARLTYASGPFNLRFGIEENSQNNNNSAPDFAGSLGFNAGMFGFRAGGEVGSVDVTGNHRTGFLVNAGINMDLGSMVKFNVGGVYTKGLACDGLFNSGPFGVANSVPCNNGTNLQKAWGVQGNMLFILTETVMMANSAGYFKAISPAPGAVRKGWSVGSALVWKPVDALQFGVEGDYYKVNLNGGGSHKALAGGVAGWFFF